MRAKQWGAMADLDPCQHPSSSSVSKKAPLSKPGKRSLRIALYMPALSASRYDPNIRAFYRHLIDTHGLKELQAVCAVMRKLLLAIHAILENELPLRTNSPFDSSRFYSPTDTVAD